MNKSHFLCPYDLGHVWIILKGTSLHTHENSHADLGLQFSCSECCTYWTVPAWNSSAGGLQFCPWYVTHSLSISLIIGRIHTNPSGFSMFASTVITELLGDHSQHLGFCRYTQYECTATGTQMWNTLTKTVLNELNSKCQFTVSLPFLKSCLYFMRRRQFKRVHEEYG